MAQVHNISNYPLQQSMDNGTPFHIFPLGKGTTSFQVDDAIAQRDSVLQGLANRRYIRIDLDNVPTPAPVGTPSPSPSGSMNM